MNELIQIGPISPLRQRLMDDRTLRGFSTETQRNYLRDVGRFATWLRRSPHTASTEDIRQFQFEQHQAGVPAPTMNSIVRSEEHTSELQSLMRISYAVFCLKKKKLLYRSTEKQIRRMSQHYPCKLRSNETDNMQQ